MKKIDNSKTLDCVAFKRKAQERISRDINLMTPAQEIAYFERRANEGELGHWWRQIKTAASRSISQKRARRSA